LSQIGFGQITAAECGSVELTLIPSQSPTQFRFELHNPGRSALLLNLGIDSQNDQYITEIRYVLTMPDGKVAHLNWVHEGVIVGMIGYLIMPLPPGTTFSFPIDLAKDFFSLKLEEGALLHLSPGCYSLQAQYTGKVTSKSKTYLNSRESCASLIWTGEAKSLPVAFTVPEIASDKHDH
jgi:hypothetical protein